jgi:hypothetical protein
MKKKITHFFLSGEKLLAQIVLIFFGLTFPIVLFVIESVFERDISGKMFSYSFAFAGFFAGLSCLLEIIRAKDQEGFRKLYSIIVGTIGLLFIWALSLAGFLVTLLEFP